MRYNQFTQLILVTNHTCSSSCFPLKTTASSLHCQTVNRQQENIIIVNASGKYYTWCLSYTHELINVYSIQEIMWIHSRLLKKFPSFNWFLLLFLLLFMHKRRYNHGISIQPKFYLHLQRKGVQCMSLSHIIRNKGNSLPKSNNIFKG